MNAAVQRRVEALEARHSPSETVTFFRIVFEPGRLDAEAGRANVAGKSIERAEDDTESAFWLLSKSKPSWRQRRAGSQ